MFRTLSLVAVLFLTACAETPRQSAVAFQPPPEALNEGAVLLADMRPEFDWAGQKDALRDGVAAYFDRYAPGWRVVDAASGQSGDLTLTCSTYHDGWSNCAEVELTCSLGMKGEERRRFKFERESETCGKGGDDASTRAEAYNRGLAIAERAAAEIAGDPEMSRIVGADRRQDLLDTALASQDEAELLAFADTYPGTPEAERARRIAGQWRARALEDATVVESGDAGAGDAGAEGAGAEVAGAGGEPEQAAPAPAPETPATPAAEAAPTTVAAAEEPPVAAAPTPADTDLSCYDTRQNMCADYSFPTVAKRYEFERKCVQGGTQVLDTFCPRDADTAGCEHRSGGTRVVTWVYGMNSGQVAQSCRANGGRVADPLG
ncbi:hypothetical protein SAMN05444336_1016 [Albimonas donghaensis]|uniref:Uncharacterized protein n=1 Tax=Albimonas donghaensis TaxID=356660 RepID=A0A1H2QBW9_9RHOB|nr:hypothetical protein [Albimonas donghaensis]SDW04585.1 hypothetical protein SAMN05444336_1016 [Albimonas donghaensis]